jgi:Na+/melibiose symporter-like transporter
MVMLAVYKVFIPNPGDVTAFYLGVWMLVLYLGFTMLNIAHNSWGTFLANDYDERSKLFGWREVFIIIGMIFVLAIPATMDFFGESSTPAKVAGMGLFCLILFPITVVATLVLVPDKVTERKEAPGWRDFLGILRSNPLLWRLLTADFTTSFAISATAALYIFVATYAFDLQDQASMALLLYFVAGFLAMPAWLKLTYRVGKVGAIKLAMGYTMVLQSGLFFVTEPGNVGLFWTYTFLAGLAFGATPTLLHSLMADLTDIDELKTGQKRAGMYFALLGTISKLGGALAVGFTLTTADTLFDFTPGAANSQTAIDGLLLIFCFVPVAAMALTYIPLHRYPLTKEKLTEIKHSPG